MTTATLIPVQQYFDPLTGDFLNDGRIFAYAAGSSTPQNLFTDVTAGTSLPNPVRLNEFGLIPTGIWGAGSYKLVIKSSDLSQTIMTLDNISAGIAVSASFQIGNLLLSGNTIEALVSNDIILQTASTGTYQLKGTTAQEARLRLFEQETNGVSYISLNAPAAIAANRAVSLPDADVNFSNINYTQIIVDAESASPTGSSSGVDTQMILNLVNQNVGSGLSSSTFTVPTTGVYHITGRVTSGFGAGVATTSAIIYKNGVNVRACPIIGSSSGFATSVVTAIYPLTVGDTIKLYVNQNIGTANSSGSLSIFKII